MKVTIVGTGYVGLVTGSCLASLGHTVACVDTDRARVETIARGEPPFHEPGLPELLRAAIREDRLSVTTVLDRAIAESDVSVLAVGTPALGERIDLGAVTAAAGEVGRALRQIDRYHVVVVKSTVIPGTTDTVVRHALETAAGRRVGEFGLCMNPEFLREGSAVADFMTPDRIVIGACDARSAEVVGELYRGFSCPKVVTSPRNAEMIKYAANALLALLVSFSNELAGLCEAVPGLDEERVMAGVHLDRRLTPPGGSPPDILSYLRAGIGFGGSCLPKDVDALRSFGAERGVETPLLDAVAVVNRERPRRVVALLEAALGGLAGRTVAILGLAFKPGTDDVRASPALALIPLLLERGALVRAYDPMVRAAALDVRVDLCSDAGTALAGADAALITTAWPAFRDLDWRALTRAMRRKLILDGRNALAGVPLPEDTTYLRIGQSPDDGSS
jgi:UDPglucose 6-dehydrogenase/GDP-mannose 6-dehydrogenase